MLLKPKLKARGVVPYGGIFDLNLPEKGIVGKGTQFQSLCNDIRRYRKANAIPIGLGFEDEVEREVCAKYPAECNETDIRIPDRNRRCTFDDVILGTKVMVRLKLSGNKLVSHEEANRRAKICSTCPNNITPALPCGGVCGELANVINAIVGGNGTPFDPKLNSCAICCCYLSASVWVPLEVQTPDLPDLYKLQFQTAKEMCGCWKEC
jgi:hypothetical protein